MSIAVAPEDSVLHTRDWLALALPGLIWGSSFYLIAEGLDAFEPFLVTWLRLLFGGSWSKLALLGSGIALAGAYLVNTAMSGGGVAPAQPSLSMAADPVAGSSGSNEVSA